MPSHWTYESCDSASGLEQGDILQPTAALNELFERVHPHFRSDKYLGFLIATQSCDLVIRGAAPKAAYISLTPIRPITQVLPKLISEATTAVSPRRFLSSKRREARQLLERLVNQNEQAMGLYFLYPDVDAGIAEAAVAFLRVTVAFRAEHYEILRAARVGRLKPDFRAKLGWLVGNLYVRPATPDWADAPKGPETIDANITRWLSEVDWVDDEIVKEIEAYGWEIGEASATTLEYFRPKSRLERALAEIEVELRRVESGYPNDAPYPDEKLKKLQNRLRNSGRFKKLFEQLP